MDAISVLAKFQPMLLQIPSYLHAQSHMIQGSFSHRDESTSVGRRWILWYINQ